MVISPISSIQSFLDYLKYQKRYSRFTVISYQTDLTDFFEFLIQRYQQIILADIKPAFVRTWLASLKENGLSSRSINRKISSLKSFFKYKLRMQAIQVSPMSTIISLKKNKRLPSFIEQKDINKLFNDAKFPDTWQGKTDQLILKIFYQTGIRLSELINLKEGQVDTSNQTIKVVGKGNKERLIPVTSRLLRDIQFYIHEKKISVKNFDPFYLLIGAKGKKLYPKYVYNRVRHYLDKTTTNDKRSPHILRHSFATHLTNNGADINAIKELLGHSSLAATQVYTHNSIERLKDVHKKTHPKA